MSYWRAIWGSMRLEDKVAVWQTITHMALGLAALSIIALIAALLPSGAC